MSESWPIRTPSSSGWILGEEMSWRLSLGPRALRSGPVLFHIVRRGGRDIFKGSSETALATGGRNLQFRTADLRSTDQLRLDAVPTRLLGAVQIAVGRGDQVLGIGVVGIQKRCDPQADRHPHRRIAEDEVGAVDRAPAALGADVPLLLGGLAQHDRELLSAVAREDVLGPDRLVDPLRDPRQHLVARLVLVVVVDLLEMVDVEHQHRERNPVAQAIGELLAQRVQEVLLVEDAGETVPRRRLVDAALVLLVQLILEREFDHRVRADLDLVAVLEHRRVHPRTVEIRTVGGPEVDDLKLAVWCDADLGVAPGDSIVVHLALALAASPENHLGFVELVHPANPGRGFGADHDQERALPVLAVQKIGHRVDRCLILGHRGHCRGGPPSPASVCSSHSCFTCPSSMIRTAAACLGFAADLELLARWSLLSHPRRRAAVRCTCAARLSPCGNSPQVKRQRRIRTTCWCSTESPVWTSHRSRHPPSASWPTSSPTSSAIAVARTPSGPASRLIPPASTRGGWRCLPQAMPPRVSPRWRSSSTSLSTIHLFVNRGRA